MFIEPTILSIIIAYIRKGRFKNLADVHIEGWYFLIISGLIQAFLSIAKKLDLSWANILLTDYFIYILTLSYILMIITVVLNLEKKSMKLFFIGIILNLIVILGNNGKMPVSLEGIRGIRNETILPYRESDIKHVGISKDTKLVYLGDIILIPPPYPLPKIISIGDIFLMLGNFMFFQEEMVREKKKADPKFLRV